MYAIDAHEDLRSGQPQPRRVDEGRQAGAQAGAGIGKGRQGHVDTRSTDAIRMPLSSRQAVCMYMYMYVCMYVTSLCT
jgi:hypothetical protein